MDHIQRLKCLLLSLLVKKKPRVRKRQWRVIVRPSFPVLWHIYPVSLHHGQHSLQGLGLHSAACSLHLFILYALRLLGFLLRLCIDLELDLWLSSLSGPIILSSFKAQWKVLSFSLHSASVPPHHPHPCASLSPDLCSPKGTRAPSLACLPGPESSCASLCGHFLCLVGTLSSHSVQDFSRAPRTWMIICFVWSGILLRVCKLFLAF